MARLDWSRQKYYIKKWLKFKEKKKIIKVKRLKWEFFLNALKRTKLNWKHVRVRGYNFYFNQIYTVCW